MDAFNEARGKITVGLIEQYFPGGDWRGDQYFISSPFRDEKTPSLAITDEGQWIDFGDTDHSGSFIDLIAQTQGLEPLEAAKLISDSPEPKVKKKAKKKRVLPPATIPVPGDTLDALRALTAETWCSKKWGRLIDLNRYEVDEGLAFCTGLFLKSGKKAIIPFYYSSYQWICGRPPGRALPLFQGENLKKNKPILIVEGEKCAKIATRLKGMQPVSWCGGTAIESIEASTWQCLTGHSVYIWPDNDKVGIKASNAIARILENIADTVHILPVDGHGWAEGYDIADYLEDGHTALEAQEMISTESIPFVDELEDEDNSPDMPFLPLGYDAAGHYWVIPESQRLPLRVSRGDSAINNDLGNIAPMQWWRDKFQSRNGSLNKSDAIEYFREICLSRGMYDPADVLGAGPHIDNGKIILNTGENLIPYGKQPIKYQEYKGKKIFARGSIKITPPANTWTKEDIKAFWSDLKTFGFASSLDMLTVAGWCAMAPWSSLFGRSPHIWLTGSSGAGKTMLLDSVIAPSLGRGIIRAEGRTSEPGLRQTIGQDCRPVVLDEFEAENKRSTANVDSILALARSAYGGSEIIKGSAAHIAVRFKTRMSFCFASVQTRLASAANASRIIPIEMSTPVGVFDGKVKLKGLRGLTFSRLPEMVTAEKEIKEHMKLCHVAGRTADTWAPIFAGVWLLIDGTDKEKMEFLQEHYIAIDEKLKGTRQSDEDAALEALLHWKIKVSPMTEITVAECLQIIKDSITPHGFIPADNTNDLDPFALDKVMRRHGIRLKTGEGKVFLNVSASNPDLSKYMADQGYEGYRDVLSRHKNFVKSGNAKRKFEVVRMAGKTDRCLVFLWDFDKNDT